MKKLGILVIVLSVCFIFLHAAVVTAAEKGTLVFAQGGEIRSMDPALHASRMDSNYSYAVFNQLFNLDTEGGIIPVLATSYNRINDNTWEFALRKGVRFHNGDPFTAADVKFSLERLLDPKMKHRMAIFYKSFKSVDIIDDYSIRIVTNNPDPLMIKRLAWTAWILPSKYIKEKGTEYFRKSPVGTGPFRFVEWIHNDRLVLELNQDYWSKAPGIKKLIIRPIPEIGTAVAELEAGGVDIITNVPPFLVNRLKSKKGVSIQSVPGRSMSLYINTLKPGPLQDKKVRQALNYAVDKQAIIDKILMGSGILNATNLTSYLFGYDPDLKPYPYDPEKAKQLLKEAGHPNLKLSFDSPSGRYLLDKQVSEVISGMFDKVGIQTTFNTHEWGKYVKIIIGKKLGGVGFIGWGNQFYDADGTLTPWFTNPKVPFCYYTDDVFQRDVAKARHSMDPDERLAIYKRLNKHLKEVAPLVFLYQQIEHYGVSDRVKGWKARGDEFVRFFGEVSVD